MLRLLLCAMFQLVALIAGFMVFVLLDAPEASLLQELKQSSSSQAIRFMVICIVSVFLALITLPVGRFFPREAEVKEEK